MINLKNPYIDITVFALKSSALFQVLVNIYFFVRFNAFLSLNANLYMIFFVFVPALILGLITTYMYQQNIKKTIKKVNELLSDEEKVELNKLLKK